MLDEINLGPGPFPRADPGSGTEVSSGGEQGQELRVFHSAIPGERSVVGAAGEGLALSWSIVLASIP